MILTYANIFCKKKCICDLGKESPVPEFPHREDFRMDFLT